MWPKTEGVLVEDDFPCAELMLIFAPLPFCSDTVGVRAEISFIEFVDDAPPSHATPKREVHLSPDLLPPRDAKYDMTLVVDIDETLVDAHHAALAIRPYARQFLELVRACLPHVEIIAWTAGMDIHAERVVRVFESQSVAGLEVPIFDHIIARGPDWYNYYKCATPYKNIFRLPGRGDTTVILDDSTNAAHLSGEHTVIIDAFASPPNDSVWSEDVALTHALQVVAFVHHVIAQHARAIRSRNSDKVAATGVALSRPERRFVDVVRTIIFEDDAPRSASALVPLALASHPFLERSILPVGGTPPNNYFILHTSADYIEANMIASYCGRWGSPGWRAPPRGAIFSRGTVIRPPQIWARMRLLDAKELFPQTAVGDGAALFEAPSPFLETQGDLSSGDEESEAWNAKGQNSPNALKAVLVS